MNLLNIYSPAETLVVTQGDKATLRDLVKNTFLDLMLKKVIRTTDITRQPHPNDPEVSYKYVVAGSNLFTYQALPHERIFLLPFLTESSVPILFRNYVKLMFEKAQSGYAYRHRVIKSPNLADQYTQGFWQKLVGGYSQTAQGAAAKTKLLTELNLLESAFPEWIETNPTKALEIWRQIKGNVFLLATVDFALLQQIDKDILKELNTTPMADDGDWSSSISVSGCSSSWDSFGDCSDSFNSSCGSDSGCSSDGGGGDSGCSSGCSGCGGGCGGGGD